MYVAGVLCKQNPVKEKKARQYAHHSRVEYNEKEQTTGERERKEKRSRECPNKNLVCSEQRENVFESSNEENCKMCALWHYIDLCMCVWLYTNNVLVSNNRKWCSSIDSRFVSLSCKMWNVIEENEKRVHFVAVCVCVFFPLIASWDGCQVSGDRNTNDIWSFATFSIF